MKSLLLTAVFAACAVLSAWQPKIIDLSWSNPTISFLQKHLTEMEKNSPLNGITIRVRGEMIERKGKKYYAGESLWTDSKIEFKHFEKDIAALKKMPFKKFTDNFYYCTTSRYDLDWFDDAQWAQAAANFGTAAKVCRAAGLKGFLWDIEEYGKRFWNYSALDTKKDLKAARRVAYKRGQQWGKAVFANYPDIVLFMPFMLSIDSSKGHLAAPFINGILSVMPPTVRIFEGYESDGYAAVKPEDYPGITAKYFRNADTMVDPANRGKYLTQVELAPSFYMDAILRHERFAKQRAEIGIPHFLRRNLAAAMKEAKTYIWFYSEAGCWWKNSYHKRAGKTWEEQAPGVTQAVVETITPKFSFSSKNLLKNPDLKDKSGWYAWQREMDLKKKVPGTITLGGGKAVFKKVKSGCIAQALPVKPGEYYLFRFRGMNRSTGTANGFVAFKDKKGKWMYSIYNYIVPMPDSGKMEEVTHLIVVPEGAYQISIQLSAGSLSQESDEVVFTGAQLIKY